MQSNDNNQPGKLVGRLTTGRAPGFPADGSSSSVLAPTVGPTGEYASEDDSPLALLADQIDQMLADHPVGVLHCLRDSLAVYPCGDGFPIYISKLWGGDHLVLEFGGWHEDGLDLPVVKKLIELALVGRIRTFDVRLNEKPWRVSAEMLGAGNEWRSLGEISYLRLTIFNRRVTSEMRQYPTPSKQ